MKVDSLEYGQNFAAMVCSTAEMFSMGEMSVIYFLPSLALVLGKGKDESLGEQRAFGPAVDVCIGSGLNVKCCPHAYVFEHLVPAGGIV